jgi:hypothetical protein
MVTALDILFNLWSYQLYFEIGMEINHLKYYAGFKYYRNWGKPKEADELLRPSFCIDIHSPIFIIFRVTLSVDTESTKTNLILPFKIIVTSDVNFFQRQENQKVPLTQRQQQHENNRPYLAYRWHYIRRLSDLNLLSKCVDNDMHAFSTW